MNNVVLTGRLTRDPELRYLEGSGTATGTFTLAVDKSLSKDKKAEFEAANKPTADFIRIVTWGKQAENCANYLAKGRLVAVEGSIQTGSYEKEGQRVYTTDVVARNVEFLEWGEKKEQAGNVADFSPGGIEGFHPANDDDIPF